MVSMNRLIVLAMLTPVFLFGGSEIWGQEGSPTLGKDLAHTLAVSTLTPGARRLPGMRFDSEKASHPEGFYWFEVTADVPGGASALLGYFAVNKVTGDVWDPVQCKKLSSVTIRRIQDHIRQNEKNSAVRSHRAATDAPCRP